MDTKDKKRSISSIVTPIILLITGLILICSPESALKIICTVAGILLAIVGGLTVFNYLAKRADVVRLVFGIVLIALAIWLLVTPESAASILMIIFGIILLTQAISHLFRLKFFPVRSSRWWSELVVSVVVAVIALLVLCNPFGSYRILMILAGIDLLIDGVIGLVAFFRKRSDDKDDEVGKEEYYF